MLQQTTLTLRCFFKWLSNISCLCMNVLRISYQFICGWTFVLLCDWHPVNSAVLNNRVPVSFQIIVLSKWRPKLITRSYGICLEFGFSVLFCTRCLIYTLCHCLWRSSLFSGPMALTVVNFQWWAFWPVGVILPSIFDLHSFCYWVIFKFLHGCVFSMVWVKLSHWNWHKILPCSNSYAVFLPQTILDGWTHLQVHRSREL